jgi:serine-type D-Ala-D-Ala endopeptidase (penicillin-binding protein 7)
MLVRALRVWGALLLILLLACPAMMADAATPHTSRTKARSTSAASSRAGKSTAKSTAGRKVAARNTRKASIAHRSRRRSARAGGSAVAHRTARRRHRAPAPPPGGVYARNAVVIDLATDKVLFEKHSEQTVPIASLTKLMTALVFLEQQPDLRRSVEVTRDEIRGGGHTQLWNRERVALYDLLHMSLMNSDNVATRVLARESGLGSGEFVARMNDKARDLGLTNTRFAEPTGLDNRNVSTAVDVAKLVRAAADHYLIREVTTTPDYVFLGEYPGRRRVIARTHQIVNTNRLLRSNRYEFSCSKTGFISQSGYCVATWVRDRGRDLIAVVLGAPTNATRFADVVRLVQRTQTASLEP